MSTIVVSPLSAYSTPSFEAVTLEILAKGETFLGLFDQLEVWRSRGTAGGPYEELTAPSWLPARLPKTAKDAPTVPVTGPTVNIVGKTLELKLKERDVIPVVFTGTNPLTYAQAAAQITAQSSGRLRAYVDEDAQLTVETLEPGTSAALRVIPSDAASLLALPLVEPDALVFGRDARIQLHQDLTTYRFIDGAGSTTYFYKTRFRNRDTSSVSEFSLPFGVAQAVGISPANLVCGFLDLVTLDGKPLVGREVSINAAFTGEQIENRLVAGTPLVKRTDHAGHVEFTLVRGQTYVLAIAGLNLAKELVAPSDPAVTFFSLVSTSAGIQDDYFKVREPNVAIMERRHI